MNASNMRAKTLICLVGAVLTSHAAGRESSQATPSQIVLPEINGLRWRNIGPNRGGRSQAVAGSVKRPLEYYFGATGGGLWKTTDAGTTWQPITDGQITSSSVGAVAVSESNPDVVYLGAGETELRSGTIQGDGIYRSNDDGKTWSHLGLADTQAIARIRVDPTNPDVVYVAALGHPYGPNEERGVFRSRDGGKRWEKVLFRNKLAGAIDLSLDLHNPRILYASLWQVYRKPWMLWSGGDNSGLFKSEDAGDHWTDITRNPGLPKGLVGKINVSVSGADSNRVYASVEAEDGGLFRSDDAGATWTRVSDEANIRQRPFYFNRIQADPRNRDTLYSMNVGLYRSNDSGRTWVEIRDSHLDHHDLWIAPDDSSRMIVANDGGASVSVSGGRTWTREEYPTGQFYHVAVTRDIPYRVCGAQQDEDTACVPSDARRSVLPLYTVAESEAAYVAPDPQKVGIFYVGDQAGILGRLDQSTGQMRDVQVNPWMFSGMPAKDLPERWQWVFPIVFSSLDPQTLYTSSQHLWKTTNGGQSWQRISPDLSRADPSTLGDSGGPITHDQNGPEIYGTIFSIAPSRLEPGTIWAGSDDGMVHLTLDGGEHWRDITPDGLPRFSRISLIEASPHKAGTAYVAANRYEMDDRQPYVFRTDDYGRTWARIVAGLPNSDFARAVREDPKRPGLLYLGTEHGVYISLDDGTHWQSLLLNLPDTQVSDLIVEGSDLIVATYGRSFYVLDGLEPLRQLTPQLADADAYLFQPTVTVRSSQPARIDYLLKHVANELTVTILDPAGKVVRRFTSGESEAKTPSVAAEAAPGIPAPQPPKAPERKPGLNRFTWDLRYPSATEFPGMVLRRGNTRGPIAVPGIYQVQLTTDGYTQRQPLVIAKDPRLTEITDSDLSEQFALAMKVRDATSESNQMVIRIRNLKQQIAERLAGRRAGDSRFVALSHSVEADLSSIEEDLYQVRNRSPRDTLNYPIKLNNQLAALLTDIEIGDTRPTDQMYKVFGELSESLATLAARLDSVEKSDLAQLNKLLRKSHADPVVAAHTE